MTRKKKLDRRVIRTRTALQKALQTLMLEKGFEAITIQEIADYANVGRGTFYLHYTDKADLLEKSLLAISQELMDYVEPYGDAEQTTNGLEALIRSERPTLERAFAYADAHSNLLLIILREASGTVFREFRQSLTVETEKNMSRYLKEPSLPISLLAHQAVNNMLALLTWWLEAERPFPPAQMVTLFHQMSYGGLGQFAQKSDILPTFH